MRAARTAWRSRRSGSRCPGLDPDAALALELPGARVLEARAPSAQAPHRPAARQSLRDPRARRRRGALARAPRALRRDRRARSARTASATQRFGRAGDNAERARALLRGRARACATAATRASSSRRGRRRCSTPCSRRARSRSTSSRRAISRCATTRAACSSSSDPARERERALRVRDQRRPGPVFGPRMTWPAGAVAQRERAVMAAHGLDPDALRLPRRARARRAPRAARAARASSRSRATARTRCCASSCRREATRRCSSRSCSVRSKMQAGRMTGYAGAVGWATSSLPTAVGARFAGAFREDRP